MKSTPLLLLALFACVATLLLVEVSASSASAPHSSRHHSSEVKSQTRVASIPESEYQRLFISFIKEHSKSYTQDEFFPRYNVFKANVDVIQAHNAGNHTYTLAMNEFGDMSPEEFRAKMSGYKPIDQSLLRSKNTKGPHQHGKALPTAVDWRTLGAVTPIKNQGVCGSGWAFSAVGALEGMWKISSSQLWNISEQELMDCSQPQGNQGCDGGMMDYAFQWVISNGGIGKTLDYPYTGLGNGNCRSSMILNQVKISTYVDIAPADEAGMLAAVSAQPISAGIVAFASGWMQFYSGGIYSNPTCGTALDHGITIVGYSQDSTTTPVTPYWIVKNSWGPTWGESGYIRILRDQNVCGIANAASYPVA